MNNRNQLNSFLVMLKSNINAIKILENRIEENNKSWIWKVYERHFSKKEIKNLKTFWSNSFDVKNTEYITIVLLKIISIELLIKSYFLVLNTGSKNKNNHNIKKIFDEEIPEEIKKNIKQLFKESYERHQEIMDEYGKRGFEILDDFNSVLEKNEDFMKNFKYGEKNKYFLLPVDIIFLEGGYEQIKNLL